MAEDLVTTQRILLDGDGQRCILRIREADCVALERIVFSRYPDREWGSFFGFGYRRTSWGLALSLVDLMPPGPGDMDRQSPLAVFRDVYSRRAFHAATSPLAVGVVHSHPERCRTWPSRLDDDMDGYFSRELSSYGSGKPYCSLILQKSEAGLTFSGRVYDRGNWLPLEVLLIIGEGRIHRLNSELLDRVSTEEEQPSESFTARLEAVLGETSASRLREATVGIVGCSGTGSPVAHVLARAGVGGFVLVDPERISPSNLERVHGAYPKDFEGEPPLKVEIMRRLIRSINPQANVQCLAGNLLHENVLDELLRCDLVLGCVDSHHGRAVLSDYSRHYLLPALDVGVLMGGHEGKVTSQIIEVTRYVPSDPCAFCRGRIDAGAMAFELMSQEELEERAKQAEEAERRGDNPDAYWRGRPRQLHTVGYLTTTAGALVTGFAEGWITGAFRMPHPTFQFDIGKEKLGVVAPPEAQAPGCTCKDHIGWGDAARVYRSLTLPPHWSRRAILIGANG